MSCSPCRPRRLAFVLALALAAGLPLASPTAFAAVGAPDDPVGSGRVVLVDEAQPVALSDAAHVQARVLGDAQIWAIEPGAAVELPATALELRAGPGELLYVAEDHDHDVGGPGLRTLAAWPGYRVVAISDPMAFLRFDHCLEVLGWIPTPPAPRERSFAARTPLDAETKAELMGRIDQARYTEILRELCGDRPVGFDGADRRIDNRWTFSGSAPGHVEDAQRYIVEHFEAAGYTVIEQTFDVFGEPTKNFIASRVGTVSPDEVVVIGAHYDSVSEDPTVIAPGAEDNASGTAAVLALAELFADYTTDRTIHFVCFGGEEQGLHGSTHYVSQLAANGWTVNQALTMDMISAWNTNFALLIESYSTHASLMDVVEANATTWAQLPVSRSTNPFGSDHMPFLNTGIPAILAIDLDWDVYRPYHRTTDTFDKVDPELGWKITTTIAGAAVDLAGGLTSVGIDVGTPPEPTRPSRLDLAAARPNPFNPRTEIAFELPFEGPTALVVYDLRGRAVRTLVDGAWGEGEHTVVWDGRDDAGRDLASGVYLYRLTHPDGLRTRRMVLLR